MPPPHRTSKGLRVLLRASFWIKAQIIMCVNPFWKGIRDMRVCVCASIDILFDVFKRDVGPPPYNKPISYM